MTYLNLDISYGRNVAESYYRSPSLYIVPQDRSYGFDSLTHQLPQRQVGYFNIQGAYNNGQCTQFAYRGCDQSNIIQTDAILHQSKR